MKTDDRLGCSFKADEVNFDREVEFAGDEMWSLNETSAVQPQLTWTRKDFGTTRLMLPGNQGPKWSQCTRRLTQDIDTGQILEARSVDEITGHEKRREFKHGYRNISTTFTYTSIGNIQPQKWKCSKCEHEGWLNTPGVCEACEGLGALAPTARDNIMVVHRQEDGTAHAWDDVSGH